MIYQALFGDKDGAYVLLKTNHPDRSFVERISNSTDLSSKPGPGIDWASSLRGFPFRDHYVILKTYLDDSPNVRFGRVFTHAFICAKDDLTSIELGQIFAVFSEKINKEINIDRELTPLSQVENYENPDTGRLAKVWRGFIAGKTVVWLGQDFESCVSFLWSRMPKNFRPDFEFDISFNSLQINPKGKISIINSPESLRSKWTDESKFEVVSAHEHNAHPNEIESFLLGAKESQAFSEFVLRHNFQIGDFEDLRIIHAIFSSYLHINTIDFHKANTALQLTLKNIHQDRSGKELGELFFVRMINQFENVAPEVVLGIRKLKMPDSVLGSSIRIQQSLQTWCANNLFKFTSDQNKKLLIPFHLNDQGVEDWWRNTIYAFIESEFSYWTDEKARVLSLWLSSDKGISIIDVLADCMTKNKKIFEFQTANIISDFLSESNSALLPEFSIRKFFLLHAAVLLKVEADDTIKIQRQIEVDQQIGSLEAIDFMREKLGGERFVVSALKQKWDSRIIQLVSSSIVDSPTLINQIHLENDFDQEVVLHILSKSDANNYYDDPRNRLVFSLLDVFVRRELSEAGKGIIRIFNNYHLLDYQNRTQVWPFVNEIGKSYLRNTAKAFLESSEMANGDSLEEPLRKEILSQEVIEWFLSKYSRNMSEVLRFFENFSEVHEKALQDYLYYFNSAISSIDSKRLGDLVSKRHWEMCAGIIYSKCDRIPSFRIALNACYSELSMFNKVAASFHGYANNGKVREDDFWNSFLEIACVLYPEGPKQNKIWKGAGGDNSDLIYYGSGREIWRSALDGVKNGAFKKISAKSILSKMLSGHPRNSDLKFLIKVYEDL